ncbi:hypothetical protein [Desulfovibrio litoralis]|uniref:DUF2225 domain-containing protein n=1 Tax=Desulfovibrio litoralis DSM 11393 TaxID=1121455 RepID=A0A1M7SYC6_9BACT|nr:hypothetical protein [Desulfovibrio litoralis]SHN63391.1 hypothetical protein SAMN02745728_01370 [Desulfovibrio litoralis DSM 11393]
MKLGTILSLVLVLICIGFSRGYSKEEVCPIDGKKFEFNSKKNLALGINQKYPECPRCGFVLFEVRSYNPYREKFKQYIMSDEYQKMRKTETQTWRIAKIVEADQRPLETYVGYLEEATLSANSKQYSKYAKEAIDRELDVVKRWESYGDIVATIPRLIIIDLYRSLGEFENAKNMILETKKMIVKENNNDNTNYKEALGILDKQLVLLDKKDIKRRYLRNKEGEWSFRN